MKKPDFKNGWNAFKRGYFSDARDLFKKQEKDDTILKAYLDACEIAEKGDGADLVNIRLDVFKEFDNELDEITDNSDNSTLVSKSLDRMVLNDDKHFFEKMETVYQSAYDENVTIAIHYCVTKGKTRISFLSKKEQGKNSLKSLKENFCGQFPGSLFNDNMTTLKTANADYVGVLSCVPSLLTDEGDVQGIENILNGIKPSDENEQYNITILAKSLSMDEIIARRDQLCGYITKLSPYAKKSVNSSESDNRTVSNGFNLGVMFFVTGGYNRNRSYSTSYSSGESYEIMNYSVKHAMDLLEKQVARFDNGLSYGMWETSIYVSSKSRSMVERVLSSLSASVTGKESYVEVPFKCIFDNGDNAKAVKDSLNCLNHPKLANQNRKVSSCLSSLELAQTMMIPKKSIPGFAVTRGVPFGRDVIDYFSGEINAGDLEIGHFKYIHADDGKDRRVKLSKSDLTMHTFVTGSTGKGKSNAIYQLLSGIVTDTNKNGEDIHYLVVEPAKGEYKDVFGNANVLCSNPCFGKLLKINPFEFKNGIHITEHIDRVLEIFNACWPMYAAMPAVLKDAIIKSYEECGWNMISSACSKGRVFPTFADVTRWIAKVIDSSSYDSENKGAYKGSLETRLKSLTNGINGRIFCGNSFISDEEMFENNTIVDLSRIGSAETKSLIMGMILIKLQEYYMSQPNRDSNADIRHVTVLEEAHNILKNTVQTGAEGGGMQAKSVEMISNAIAEMRTYGEAFIIVDQSPSAVDTSVIKNTNTKIVLGLPHKEDRELVGRSMGLNDEQIEELAKLEKGTAAVYQNNWAEAVLCGFDRYTKSIKYTGKPEDELNADNIAKYVICPELFEKVNPEELRLLLSEENISEEIKGALHTVYVLKNRGTLSNEFERLYISNLTHLYKKYIDLNQLTVDLYDIEDMSPEESKTAIDQYFEERYAINRVLLEEKQRTDFLYHVIWSLVISLHGNNNMKVKEAKERFLKYGI